MIQNKKWRNLIQFSCLAGGMIIIIWWLVVDPSLKILGLIFLIPGILGASAPFAEIIWVYGLALVLNTVALIINLSYIILSSSLIFSLIALILTSIGLLIAVIKGELIK